jgi:hypothetical protein
MDFLFGKRAVTRHEYALETIPHTPDGMFLTVFAGASASRKPIRKTCMIKNA